MTTTDHDIPTAGAPVFGQRTAPQKRCDFILCSYDSTGAETQHTMTARAEVDAATALAVMGRSDSRDAGFIQRFLIRCLVDDDGVGRHDEPQPIDLDLDLDDADTDDEAREQSTELALLEYRGDWTLGGQTFPSQSLAEQHAAAHGSSLRRFAALMDDPFSSVQLDALREILKYVVAESAGRPTGPSSRSQRRRAQKKAAH